MNERQAIQKYSRTSLTPMPIWIYPQRDWTRTGECNLYSTMNNNIQAGYHFSITYKNPPSILKCHFAISEWLKTVYIIITVYLTWIQSEQQMLSSSSAIQYEYVMNLSKPGGAHMYQNTGWGNSLLPVWQQAILKWIFWKSSWVYSTIENTLNWYSCLHVKRIFPEDAFKKKN